jgi:hypothetical protein
MSLPRISNHGSEVGLLAFMSAGIVLILTVAVFKNQLGGEHAIDVAAFLLVLQRIVEAIQKRWEQRSVDRMGDQLAGSAPADGPTGKPGDPMYTTEDTA